MPGPVQEPHVGNFNSIICTSSEKKKKYFLFLYRLKNMRISQLHIIAKEPRSLLVEIFLMLPELPNFNFIKLHIIPTKSEVTQVRKIAIIFPNL